MAESDNERSKWAELLFDEWKYRHTTFWRTLYRSLGAIAVLVAIPFAKKEFGPMAHGWGMVVYECLPFIIFIALCFVLTLEHARLSGVEKQLEGIRDKYEPLKPDPWGVLKKRWKIAIPFIVIGLALLVSWVVILCIRKV